MGALDWGDLGLQPSNGQAPAPTLDWGDLGLKPSAAQPQAAPASQAAPAQPDTRDFGTKALDYTNGVLRSFSHGLSLGLDTPMDAAANAITAPLYGKPMGQAYRQYMDNEAQKRAAFGQENPIASGVASFGGQAVPSLMGMEAVGGALNGLGPVGQFLAGNGGNGAGLLGRAASTGAAGAIQGGTQGLLTSQLSDQPVGDQMLTGAATGGALGTFLPLAGATVRAIRNGALGVNSITPERAAMAQRAMDTYNWPLTATDIVPGTPAAKWMGSVLDYLPFSGAAGRKEGLQQAVNRSVSETMGGDAGGNAVPKITGGTVEGAEGRVGDMYHRALNGVSFAPSADMATDLNGITARVGLSPLNGNEAGAVNGVIRNINDTIAANGGNLTGDIYQGLRQRGSALDDLASSQGLLGRFGREIRGALDDEFARSAPPDNVALYNQANQQWRAIQAIRPQVIKGDVGDISPLRIQNAANTAYPNRSRTDAQPALGEIGDLAQLFLKKLPDSGTAPRNASIEMLKHVGGALGGAGVGAGAAGAGVGTALWPLVGGAAGAIGLGRMVNSAINSQGLARLVANAAMNPAARSYLERNAPQLTPYLLQAAQPGLLGNRQE